MGKKKRIFSISLDPSDGHENDHYLSSEAVSLKVEILDEKGKRLSKKIRTKKSITLVCSDFCDKNGDTLGPIELKMYRFADKTVYVGEADSPDQALKVQVLDFDKKSRGGTYTLAWGAGLEELDDNSGVSTCPIYCEEEEQQEEQQEKEEPTGTVDVEAWKKDEPEEDVFNVSIGVKHLVLETKDIPELDKLDGDKWKRVSLIQDTKDPKKRYLLTNHRHKGSFGKVRYSMTVEGDDTLVGVKVFRLTEKENASTSVTNREEFEAEKDVMEKADAKVKFQEIVEVQKDKLGNPKKTLFAFMPLMACDLLGIQGLPDIDDGDKKHVAAYMLWEMASDLKGLHEDLKRIHFDIKPGNVMASKETVAVIDFGATTEFSKINFDALELRGTPEYYHPLLFWDVDAITEDELRETIDIYACVMTVVETMFGKDTDCMSTSSFWPKAEDLRALPSVKSSYGRWYAVWKPAPKVAERMETCAKASALLSYCLQAEIIEREVAEIRSRYQKKRLVAVKKAVEGAKIELNDLMSGYDDMGEDAWKGLLEVLDGDYTDDKKLLEDAKKEASKDTLGETDALFWFGECLEEPIKDATRKISQAEARALRSRKYGMASKFEKEACKDYLLRSLQRVKAIDPHFYEKILLPVASEKPFGREMVLEAIEGNGETDLEKGKKLLLEQLEKAGATDNETAARELLLVARKKVSEREELVVSVPRLVQPQLVEPERETISEPETQSPSEPETKPSSDIVIEVTSLPTEEEGSSAPGLLHDLEGVKSRANERKQGHYQINSSYFAGVLHMFGFYNRKPSKAKLVKLHKSLCEWYFNMKDEKEYVHRYDLARGLYLDVLEQAKKDKAKEILGYKDSRGVPFE